MPDNEAVRVAARRHDELFEQLKQLKVMAAEASARARMVPREDRVEAARHAAELRAQVSDMSRRVKAAEKELGKAQKDADAQARKRAAAAYKKQHEAEAAARAQARKTDPFLAKDIDYPALGAWLAQRASDRACFVEGCGWGEWTGTHWQFSRKASASLLDRVRHSYRDREGDVVSKLNANARSAHHILDHAQAALTQPRHLFNSAAVAHLVAFRNTTVDLRTGETVPHDPKHYMTGCLPTAYDTTADIQRVQEVFSRFWPDDPETADMFQTAVGYSLTGEVSAKRIFFMVGNQNAALENGDNGKSLVQNALLKMFGLGAGGWGAAIKSSLIIDAGDRDANGHDGGKLPLIWRRFAMASEFRHGATIDAGEFNRLSGGDIQTVRPPHGDQAIEFVNQAAMWFSMNTVPRFKTWDKATRLRLTPFPFTQTFWDPGCAPEGEQEKEIGLKEWLESVEGQKALALYAVRGAVRFYELNASRPGNFPDSAAVSSLRDQILSTANPFSDMFEEWLTFSESADTLKSAMSILLDQHLGRKARPHERDLFSSALKGMGVREVKIKGYRYWRGVGLSDDGRAIVEAQGIKAPDSWRRAAGVHAHESRQMSASHPGGSRPRTPAPSAHTWSC
jgi:P4 family phage/plasmid primase-like protien